MATKIQCDRCGFETEFPQGIGEIRLRKAQVGTPCKEFDLCPNCLEDVLQVITDDIAAFKAGNEPMEHPPLHSDDP